VSRRWDWLHNEHALELREPIRVLERAARRLGYPACSPMSLGAVVLQERQEELRRQIARDCAPWFDGSAFCTNVGLETAA
jgi:hypothetical protein